MTFISNAGKDMNIEIINAKEKPLNEYEIRSLVEIEHHLEIRRWDIDVHDKSKEEMYQAFKKFLAKLPENENQEMLIAKSDGKVVGFLGIHRLNKRMTHVGEAGITVHPNYQSRGIGTKLLKNAVGVAKKMGLRRLEADTLADNIAMIKTAQKVGFQIEGVRKMRIQKEEEYKDETLMALILDETYLPQRKTK